MYEVEKTYWSGADGEVQWTHFKKAFERCSDQMTVGIARARPTACKFHIALP